MNQGYWEATLETLSLVIVAALVSTLIGVPLGIAAAHRPRLYAAMRPVLDLMQTLPTFVYLIPTLVLFGLGVVPGLISTVIFALPAPIRLTHLGISSVPKSLLEAGEAFGATQMQMLWKVELPSAAPTILAGITQCIMLSLSMVVIAALVGAGGLGVPVVRALNTVQVGMGFEAGFVIVLLAIVLDRISRPRGQGRPAMKSGARVSRDVDILFCAKTSRRASAQAIAAALAQLDGGGSRSEIAEQTGVVVGVANASLAVEPGARSACSWASRAPASRRCCARPTASMRVTRGRCWWPTARPRSTSACSVMPRRCGASAASASPWCSSSSACCPGAPCARTWASAWSCAATRPTKRREIVDEKLELVGLSQWASDTRASSPAACSSASDWRARLPPMPTSC